MHDATPRELQERLDALEARVVELESDRAAAQATAAAAGSGGAESRKVDPSDAPSDADPYFALHAVQERMPAPGGVLFAGSVDVGLGHLEYQWGRPTEHLLEADWAEHAETVAALGHPLRLTILRRLLDAEHTVAQLVDELQLASSGVAYHHLSALQAAGWVTSPRRGSWTLPPSRVVPLLAILTALEKG